MPEGSRSAQRDRSAAWIRSGGVVGGIADGPLKAADHKDRLPLRQWSWKRPSAAASMGQNASLSRDLGRRSSLFLAAPMDRGRDAHRFAVFGDRSARNVD